MYHTVKDEILELVIKLGESSPFELTFSEIKVKNRRKGDENTMLLTGEKGKVE